MRVFITGSDGFIGKNLYKYLIDRNYEVAGWDYSSGVIPDIEGFDAVVHLGAISSTTERDIEKIMVQNFEFSMLLLQRCIETGTNFHYASSASVYGSNQDFREDAPLSPQSPYAWSKYLFDRAVNKNINDFPISVTGFRYFNVYGDGEEHKGDQASPVTKFTRQANETGKVKLFNNSEQCLRDFVWVGDVCEAHEKFLHKSARGVYNIGTGKATSFESIAKSICNKYDAEIEYIEMPEALKNQYQYYTCADLTKLNEVINMRWHTVQEYLYSK